MKKIIIATFAVAIVAALTFTGCKKENNEVDNSKMRIKKNLSNEFSSIDMDRIGYDSGMLVFESVFHYAQTIDTLVAICDRYSENYRTELEGRLGCNIEDADEEVVSDSIIADNFFPYNPLLDFIALIGFSESAYPVLREQEINWLADEDNFEFNANPFDSVGAGYVQSALHNVEGYVYISNFDDYEITDDGLVGEKIQKSGRLSFHHTHHFGTNPNNECGKRDKSVEESQSFNYDSKDRKIKGILVTSGIHVRGKTVNYYKNRHNNWILWTHKVYLNYSGEKWTHCNYESPISVPYTSKQSFTGLVEKYYWFHTTPTYLIPYGSIYSIVGNHSGKNYSETRTTILSYN